MHKAWAWCLTPVITYPHSEMFKVIPASSQFEASLGYMGPCFIKETKAETIS